MLPLICPTHVTSQRLCTILLPTDHSVLICMNVTFLVPVTEATVKQWIDDEKTVICSAKKGTSK